jgi:hypothetical protein
MLLIDSDIIIDGARGNEQAIEFLGKNALQHVLAISTITHLELLAGCRNSREWTLTQATVHQFAELELTPEISRLAVTLFDNYRLSHGIAMADSLIAATALSHGIPLVSKNQRHFRYIENLNLSPYPPAP